MTRAAEFKIIEATPFTLDPAGPNVQQIVFALHAGFDPSFKSLLFYQVNPDAATGTPKWRVDMNGNRIASYELAGQAFRMLLDIVPDNVLVAGANNTITFEVNTAGAGPLVFSNVVLLCHNAP